MRTSTFGFFNANMCDQGDGGRSCTQVIHEFVDNGQDQENFIAEVKYHADSTILTHVGRHVQSIRLKYDPEAHADADDLEDLNEFVRDNAEPFFKSILCNLPEFSNEAAMKAFFTACDEASLVNELMRHIIDYMKTLDIAKSKNATVLMANTLDELQTKVRPYMEPSSDPHQPAP